MNNKGFMMAEVIVVSSIILVALVGLYASYNKIFSVYNKRVDYYDVATLYELAEIKKASLKKGVEPSLDPIYDMEIIGNYIKTVYYLNKDELEGNTLWNSTLKFDEYLLFLRKTLSNDVKKFFIMENCDKNNKDNCKYAYLEVLDETS